MADVKFTFNLVDKMTASLKGIQKSLDETEGKLRATSKELEQFHKRTEHLSKFGKKLTDIGKGLTVGVTLPVVAMGGAMVKAAADIEAMQQQLSTMLGSTQKGAEMFDKIKTMAAKTPFETKDLMKATNTMLGFGIAQEKVIPLMNQLGDISGGNADRFQSLALAFSQVSSAGKLQGQDLLQMINAGFNPLESIAKRTGKSVGYWKEQMSKGKVTVNMVEQAMKDATSEGGRFFNMMEKQSKTALGQWSTFQDNLNMLLADFGKIILPTAIKGLQKLSSTLEWFNSLSSGAKRAILIVGGIAAAIGPITIALGGLVTAIASLNTAFLWLGANPIVGTIALWTGAIWGVVQALRALWALIQRIGVALDKGKIGSNLNLSSDKVLGYLSQQREEMGAKAFNKMYDRSAQKAVENYNKTHNISNSTTNMTNSNNTTTTHVTNNYMSSRMPMSPAYAI